MSLHQNLNFYKKKNIYNKYLIYYLIHDFCQMMLFHASHLWIPPLTHSYTPCGLLQFIHFFIHDPEFNHNIFKGESVLPLGASWTRRQEASRLRMLSLFILVHACISSCIMHTFSQAQEHKKVMFYSIMRRKQIFNNKLSASSTVTTNHILYLTFSQQSFFFSFKLHYH